MFRVGDIVVATKEISNCLIINGKSQGKILRLDFNEVHDGYGHALIEFFDFIDGHSGDNDEGKDGHCWWIQEKRIALVKRANSEVETEE